MRTAVVTGPGLVTPLATGVEESWKRLIAGRSGAGPITRFDASDMPCRIACEVKTGDGSDGTFNPDHWVEPKEQRRYDKFIVYGMAGAKQAADAGGAEPGRPGVLIGSGIGGLPSIESTAILIHEKGPRRVSPFFIPGSLIN